MEITAQILIVLSAVFALIQVIMVKDTFARIINAVFAIAVGVTLIPVPEIAIDGYYLFLIGCLLVILYSFNDPDFTSKKKGALITIGGIQLLGMLFFVMRWPYVIEVWLLGVISVGIYVGIVVREIQQYRNEIGFLTVLAISGFINFFFTIYSMTMIGE